MRYFLHHVLLLWVLLLGAITLSNGAEFCALKIEVMDDRGAPISATKAILKAPNGSVVAETTIQDGRGEICDFGDEDAYTLEVGSGRCMKVSVGGIRFVYDTTWNIKVILNACLYGGHGFSNACFFLLRIKDDADNSPVAASVSDVRINRGEKADSFGRWLTAVGPGKSAVIGFDADGYERKQIELKCPEGHQSPQANKVVTVRLRRSQH